MTSSLTLPICFSQDFAPTVRRNKPEIYPFQEAAFTPVRQAELRRRALALISQSVGFLDPLMPVVLAHVRQRNLGLLVISHDAPLLQCLCSRQVTLANVDNAMG